MGPHQGGDGATSMCAPAGSFVVRHGTSDRRPSGRKRTVSSETEIGAVTAEVAVVLPALVVLLALLLGTAHVGTQQLRLEEAARAGAREAMRGESADVIHRTTQRLAGSHATASITSGEGWVTVEVRAAVQGPLVDLLDVDLTASASGLVEHGG